MSKPSFKETVGGYLIEWPDTKIEARASRIHVHQDGHVTGMLSITSHNGTGSLRLLPNTQFNFSSEITRSKQAKQLSEKFSDLNCSWIEMFDYLGESIQSASLSGNPAIEVQADEDAEAPTLLIEPLVYEGHQNIIYGEKGVNKTTLAYSLGIFLTIPEVHNSLNLKINSIEPVRSLVLDWETDEKTFRWYLGRLVKGLQCGPVPLFYRQCRLPLFQDIESISDEISRTGAKIIIIDSLGAAAGGDLKDSQTALDFLAAIRKLPGITSIVIGQTAKNQDNKKSLFGSTYFTYYARNVFELCKGDDGEPGVLHLGLFHRECNFNIKSKPIGVKVSYLPNGGISVEREVISMDEFSEKVSVALQIEHLISREKLTRKEIIDRLHSSEGATDMALKRLKDSGKAIQFDGKKWGLISNEKSN